MRLAVSAGGTGGHVLPGIALAEQAVASGVASRIVFIGAADGIERRIVPAYGFDIETLPVGRVRGMSLTRKAAGLAGLGAALPKAAAILRRFGADVVVGMGGYASAPALVAARMLGIPTVLCEQNTIPGSTNRLLARFARKICISFSMSSGYLPSWKTVLTGNPVRPSLAAARAARAARPDGPLTPFRILVLGGSQGALFLNQTISACLADLARADRGISVIHQTGRGRTQEVGKAYDGLSNVSVVGYIEDMARMLEQSSLVVGRAGATTVAELAAVGVPSILVPFPFATDDHQWWNARVMERAGAARVVEQHSFNEGRFLELVTSLSRGPAVVEEMGRAALAQGRIHAADEVLNVVRSVI